MKYILPILICGSGNQFVGLKETIIIAKKLNRKLILPDFIPHGTIRNKSNISYTFDTTFDIDKLKSIVDVKYVNEIDFSELTTIYKFRCEKEDSLVNSYINICDKAYSTDFKHKKCIRLKKKYIQNEN